MPETQSPRSAELPIPDFDSAPWGALQPRLRGLDRAQIEMLLEYERAHANRTAYIEFLEQRLRNSDDDGQGLPNSGSSAGAPASPPGQAVQGGSRVSPQTQGPPINPPSHGDPTNPGQPRS